MRACAYAFVSPDPWHEMRAIHRTDWSQTCVSEQQNTHCGRHFLLCLPSWWTSVAFTDVTFGCHFVEPKHVNRRYADSQLAPQVEDHRWGKCFRLTHFVSAFSTQTVAIPLLRSSQTVASMTETLSLFLCSDARKRLSAWQKNIFLRVIIHTIKQ